MMHHRHPLGHLVREDEPPQLVIVFETEVVVIERRIRRNTRVEKTVGCGTVDAEGRLVVIILEELEPAAPRVDQLRRVDGRNEKKKKKAHLSG